MSEQYKLSEKPGVTKQVVYYLAKYTDENPRVVRPQEVRSFKSLCLEEALAVIDYESKKDLLLKADKYIKELDLMGFC